jgi:hypothetical protein
MIVVFELYSRRCTYHGEEDVPTQQQQAKEDARLQSQNIDQGRPAGAEAPARQGTQKADSEWLKHTARDFLGSEELYGARTTGQFMAPG